VTTTAEEFLRPKHTADVFLLRNITATKDTKDPGKITEFYVYITRSSYQITKRRIIHTFLPPYLSDMEYSRR
jgi:hypothetical protein